jgi:hypothetical protein
LRTMRPLISTLLLLMVTVPPSVLAESNGPAEIREVNAELSTSPANYAMIAPPKYAPPDAPSATKVIDKKFIAAMASLAGAETLRLTTHQLVLEHEYAAGAPWVTSVPSTPHMIGKYGTIFASEALLAYELKKPHRWLPGDHVIQKLWWVVPGVMTPIHIKNGARSIGTQAPAGCPVAECGPQ